VNVRRLLLLVSAIVLVDTAFYAAISPLLPYYSDRLDLSKSAAGVLAAAYPAGTLVASLPGGWLATRIGVKPTVLVGLGLMSVSSLVFGLADSVVVLDGARFLQGVGGAASWAGGLAWLVASGPAERRGELIGTAFGAAVGGALLGPVLGAAARGAGPEPVFAGVAVLGVALMAWTASESAAAAERSAHTGLLPALRRRLVLAGLAMIVLVGLFFGVVEVLVPLRLDDLGASGPAIGGVFLASAAIQAVTSPVIGRYSDRRGPERPILFALACAVGLAIALPAAGTAALVAALAIGAGPTVGALWGPGMSMLSAGAEDAGLDQAYAFALVNLAWAAAQTFGAGVGGAVAEATTDATAYAIVAAVMAAALVLAALRGRAHPVPS
jgi:MFS family permease